MDPCLCRGCRRPIRSARSLRTGYGPRCYTAYRAQKKRRSDAARAVINAYRPKPATVSMALLLISGRDIVHVRKDIYRVRSLGDRATFYLASPRGCNCIHNLKRSMPSMCKHRLAAALEECW